MYEYMLCTHAQTYLIRSRHNSLAERILWDMAYSQYSIKRELSHTLHNICNAMRLQESGKRIEEKSIEDRTSFQSTLVCSYLHQKNRPAFFESFSSWMTHAPNATIILHERRMRSTTRWKLSGKLSLCETVLYCLSASYFLIFNGPREIRSFTFSNPPSQVGRNTRGGMCESYHQFYPRRDCS